MLWGACLGTSDCNLWGASVWVWMCILQKERAMGRVSYWLLWSAGWGQAECINSLLIAWGSLPQPTSSSSLNAAPFTCAPSTYSAWDFPAPSKRVCSLTSGFTLALGTFPRASSLPPALQDMYSEAWAWGSPPSSPLCPGGRLWPQLCSPRPNGLNSHFHLREGADSPDG